MTKTPRVRRANLDDIEAIRRITTLTWRVAYPWIPAGEREAFLAAACSRRRLIADLTDPTIQARVVVDRKGVSVGAAFLSLGAGRTDGELIRLDVLPEHHGRGYRRALFIAACDGARAAGRMTLWVSVFAQDRPGLAWTARLGGHPSHASERLFGAVRIPEAVYRFDLAELVRNPAPDGWAACPRQGGCAPPDPLAPPG